MKKLLLIAALLVSANAMAEKWERIQGLQDATKPQYVGKLENGTGDNILNRQILTNYIKPSRIIIDGTYDKNSKMARFYSEVHNIKIDCIASEWSYVSVNWNESPLASGNYLFKEWEPYDEQWESLDNWYAWFGGVEAACAERGYPIDEIKRE